MIKMTICQFHILIVLVTNISGAGGYIRGCYYTNWAQYRGAPYNFVPENVDVNQCTHIFFAFAKIVGEEIQQNEWNDDSSMYGRITNLKISNPDLKIVLGVGGWNHGVVPFSDLVDNEPDIHTFAANAITYLRARNFDGLDIDWEYPTTRGSPLEDKQRFTRLCEILRDAFDNEATTTGNPRLLLTAAVAAREEVVLSAYEVTLITAKLDFIKLMTFELQNSSFLGIHSPLYSRSDETGEETKLNVDYAVTLWINQGAPAEKILVGFALYGKSFTMVSGDHTLGLPALALGLPGPFTGEAGFLSYYEICQNIKLYTWTRVWNDEQKVPYAYKGQQWVGYDDEESITIKVNYIKSRGLAGSFVWAMDLEDFTNSCNTGDNPLLTTISEVASIPITTQPPVTTQQPPATTETLNGDSLSHITTSGFDQHSIIGYGSILDEKEVRFKVKGLKDAQVRLHSQTVANDLNYFYKIAIAALSDTVSIISLNRGNTQVELAHYYQTGLMDVNEYREFWISWENETILVGRGNETHKDVFLQWSDPCKLYDVKDVVISTDHTTTVHWIIHNSTTTLIPNDEVKSSMGFMETTSCPSFELVTTYKANSKIMCSLLCFSENACYGFNFINVTHTCQILSNNVIAYNTSSIYRLFT